MRAREVVDPPDMVNGVWEVNLSDVRIEGAHAARRRMRRVPFPIRSLDPHDGEGGVMVIGSIHLRFQGEPKAIQSVRFAQFGGHVQKYQPRQNVEWKNWIRLQAQSQLPREFKIFDEEAQISVSFLFPPPRAWSKAKLAAMASGTRIGKTTKPDLVDNLMKGLCDALTSIVWRDDSIITRVSSEKRYSPAPGIILDVEGK